MASRCDFGLILKIFYVLSKTLGSKKTSDKELWYLDGDPLFGPFQNAKSFLIF